MAASKRETIMARTETVLKTISADIIPTAQITRTRIVPFSKVKLPFINIRQGPAPADEKTVGKITWKLRIEIDVYQDGTSNAPPDKEADPILNEVSTKMLTAFDAFTYVIDCTPAGVFPEYDDGDESQVLFTQVFEVNFRTNKGEM